MELMSDLRKFFYRTNKELVLLIEDFAQLQGVDTALLQILTEDGKKAELCKIKWAMAVTTGYYEKLADTVRTRIAFKVYMDSSWDKGNILNQNKYILNLGSKYLNAIRLGNKKINEWFISYKEKSLPIFNACSFCDKKDICHKAFGSVDGIGLYPFNEISLLKMARQADKEKKDVFRPRIFINNVIRRNLKTLMAQVIKDGQYPPRDLYDDFNTEQISFDEINKLTKIDPLEHIRRETLLELWSSTDKIVNLDDKIHTAFSLPALNEFNYFEKDVLYDDEPNISSPPSKEHPKNESNEHIKNIEKWGRGNDLHHGIASELRGFIYAAIMDNIEWDSLPVAKTMNIFKRDHIYFKGQTTRKPTSGYILEIEQNIDLAMIFKTLYLMNKDKKLTENLSFFTQLQEQILVWSEYIIDENTKYYGPVEGWNPTNAAIELLILSSVVGSTGVSIDSLFQSNIEYPKLASSKLLSLITDTFIEKNRKDTFLDLFEKTYTGRKGGSKTSAFVDVNKVLPIIISLKKNNWKLLQDPSKENRKIFKEIASIYTSWKLNFEDCLTDELIERFKWLDQLDKRIEIDDIDIKFKNKIKKLRETCANNGIPGYQSKSLDDALKCNLVQAKKGLDIISKFQEQPDNVAFTELFPSRRDEIILFVKLITVYEEVLDKVSSELSSRVEELNRGTGLSSINLEIKTSIDKIDVNLNKIIGNSNNAY